MRVGDVVGTGESEYEIEPTYKPDVIYCNINEVLPEFVCESMREGIFEFDKKIKGFADANAVITVPETRSSSRVRILRDETMQSNIKGIYPCGEGAGYAGGIVSSAVDGILAASKLIQNHQKG